MIRGVPDGASLGILGERASFPRERLVLSFGLLYSKEAQDLAVSSALNTPKLDQPLSPTPAPIYTHTPALCLCSHLALNLSTDWLEIITIHPSFSSHRRLARLPQLPPPLCGASFFKFQVNSQCMGLKYVCNPREELIVKPTTTLTVSFSLC